MAKKFPGQDAVTRMFALVKAGLAGKLDKIGGSPGQMLGFGDAGQVGAVTIRAGDNVSVTRSGNVITISADGGGQSSGRIFTVSVDTDPKGGGTADGGGLYQEGAQCTVTASAGSSYTFAGWRVNGSVVSTEASRTFTVAGDTSLTAVFNAKEKMPVYYGMAENLSLARYNIYAMTAKHYALFYCGCGSEYSGVVDAYDSALTRTTPSPLSVVKIDPAGTPVGDYALIGGGGKVGGGLTGDFHSAVDAYDASLTRTAATALSAARRALSAASVGNYALFAGGDTTTSSSSNSKLVDAYNSSLTRTSATGLSMAASEMAAVSAGGYAMFGGGSNDMDLIDVVNAYSASLTRVTPTVLSQARYKVEAVSVGSCALFYGGQKARSGYENMVNIMDVYDASLTRTTATPLSVARLGASAVSFGNYAMFGGGGNDDGKSAIVDVYDKSLTRTTTTPLSAARSTAAAAVGNYALFAGGYIDGPCAIVDVYTLK